MPNFRRILLVEDSDRDAELVISALRESRLANEIVLARDGVEALDYLYARGRFAGHTDGLPVVAFLDLKMPRMDGLELLQRMKSDPVLKQIPAVMITSSREEQDLIRSYALGVNAYVVKPVDFTQFFDSITRMGFFWGVINEPPPGGCGPRREA